MKNNKDMPVMSKSSESPVEKSAGEPELKVPEFEETVVEIIDPSESDSDMEVPLVPAGGIEVVALRKGFFGQQRVREGDKFRVKKLESLGTWMSCVDPVMEKKRQELLNSKKAK